MKEHITIFLLAFLVLTAPAWSDLVRKYAKINNLSPNSIMVIMVLCISSTILAYAGLVRFAVTTVSELVDLNWYIFLETQLTGKGLMIYTMFLMTLYCGWYFLLYPLIRDFEQLRQEANHRKQKLKKPN